MLPSPAGRTLKYVARLGSGDRQELLVLGVNRFQGRAADSILEAEDIERATTSLPCCDSMRASSVRHAPGKAPERQSLAAGRRAGRTASRPAAAARRRNSTGTPLWRSRRNGRSLRDRSIALVFTTHWARRIRRPVVTQASALTADHLGHARAAIWLLGLAHFSYSRVKNSIWEQSSRLTRAPAVCSILSENRP